MNNHFNSYNLEPLRKRIRSLERENKELKVLLNKNNISYEEKQEEQSSIENNFEYDLDQGGRIKHPPITNEMVASFFSMFRGRKDVYAKRGSKGGYFPQCLNRFNNKCPIYRNECKSCQKECESKKYAPLTIEKLKNHLIGLKEDCSDVLGIYPLLEDDTCRLLVFDFDNHNEGENNDFIEEVDSLRKVLNDNNISYLTERSRSGNGAHIWIFFKQSIKASLARNFGYLLLDRGLSSVNIKDFKYYDRMYPSQDKSNGLGNLVALPLQGRALQNGNSAFVDENWNAYEDQWDVLINNTHKYDEQEIKDYVHTWMLEISRENKESYYSYKTNNIKPWRKTNTFDKDDVDGSLYITLANGVYVDSLNLMPKISNQIRSLAAFDNPIFYKNRNIGLSNYNQYSSIYLGEDVDNYIHIPRGTFDTIVDLCKQANINYEISNERIKGRKINVTFNGQLRNEQTIAVNKILNYDDGILEAATAFGKTVVCSYLIAHRKVSTLILLQNTSLIQQWKEELEHFLIINEELPIYKTNTGRTKKRTSIIGQLHGSKDSLTGIIDIAMIGTLNNRKDLQDILNNYGMVIFDECHHGASSGSVQILSKVNSRYLYGVSATPYRSDKLEKINYLLLGQIRHSYTEKEKNMSQDMKHYIRPRFTRIVDNYETKDSINAAYNLIVNNKLRNNMILDDIKQSIKEKRIPLVLTKQKDHAKYLYEELAKELNNVYLLYGDNTDKENNEIIKKLKSFSDNDFYILIATGQKVGEGFDLPRLDTLFMASPISYEGRVLQYLGRLNRDYKNKSEVIVYDYIDSHMYYFKNMYYKRLKTYKKIGFLVKTNEHKHQEEHLIYNCDDYYDVFIDDIKNANKRLFISSSDLTLDKVETFINEFKVSQQNGCVCTIVTDDNGDNKQELIS